jgi:TonB family protein
MEFLSLEHPPEPSSGRRLTRAEAIGLSVLAHLLLLLLFMQGSRLVPESVMRWLEARAVPVRSQVAATDRPPDEAVLSQPKPPESRIPLKFAYVKVPNDTTTPNKNALLLSDRDRRARQEVPTPSDAKLFTRDPHSEGQSIDRVRPDPSLKEGPDAPTPSGPESKKPAAEERPGLTEGEGAGPDKAAQEKQDDAKAGDEEAHDATMVRGDLVPPTGGAGASPPQRTGETGAQGTNRSTAGHPATVPGGGARTPADLKPHTEYKFQFNNPGWLKGGGFGTMSFDTQGFPWGDYARLLYVAIRNAWLERIPLAAREGIAGFTCQHFVIAREGSITTLEVVRPSAVPPFTKAASDAIRAASPVPPLPSDFPKSEEGVTFCFYYNMYPGEAD